MTPLEFLASGLKLHGGAMGALVIASQAVRKGGTIQVTGVYGGRYNAFPLGDIFNRNVDIKTGQAPVIPYMPFLYDMINQGKVDPGDIITHVLPLEQAKHGYEVFDTRTEDCIKVIVKPLNRKKQGRDDPCLVYFTKSIASSINSLERSDCVLLILYTR
ncbi:threonine dehydrogenase-like Zn-dependent dehydrogenase [Bacillus sp. SORGH_AS 510]|nr:threonine dehydrogenase-like Zn-dependent dehydrogenase [Bacillus sp. SORGH_AS_0510]